MSDPETISFEQAVSAAARLLRNAETITDLALMERLDEMASTWVHLAGLLHEHSRA